MSANSDKPLLIYDGNCGFCRRWIHRWRSQTGGRVRFAPAREAVDAVELVEAGGKKKYRGAEAVFRVLTYAPGGGGALWCYRRLPGFAPLAELFYALVARHRIAASRLTEWLWGKSVEPSRYFLGRWIFLRGLGGVYLIAFLSLWVQLPGLMGSGGILPAEPLIQAVRRSVGTGPGALLEFPSLALWFGASDFMLQAYCALGAALSVALILGFAQRWAAAGLWALYLTLVLAGRDFMGFQWESLLLETGLLALFIAPRGLSRSLAVEAASPPSRAGVWLLRFLLFRLMFSSGVVKLTSGDESWRGLTALTVHYETQPLPTWTAWWMHQLPREFHVASAAVMFAIELGVPFLIFLPRRPRRLGFALLVFLQLAILMTGNYAYFNLLSLLLCVLLLDDGDWRRVVPHRLTALLSRRPGPGTGKSPAAARPWRGLTAAGLALVFFLAGASRLALLKWDWPELPSPARVLIAASEPFRSVNSYGLFAVMTQTRPEIIVEGSDDGQEWREFEFRYKPGNPRRRPVFVAPHQPRLDWQMWFAALGTYEGNTWFQSFEARLLEGAPDVLALLEKDPFGGRPPRFVRGTLYQYRFTTLAESRAGGGEWWRRVRLGPYGGVVSANREP